MFMLRGRITASPDGQAVEGATVSVHPGNAAAMSRNNGVYQLRCTVADTLTVTVSCVGYVKQRRKLINPSGELTLNMRLVPQEHTVEEVTVTELRKRTGTMEQLDIKSYHTSSGDPTGGSVESMLSTMPGVTGASELSSQYSVRGGSYDENSVTLNGFEIYRPRIVTSQSQEGLSILNPAMVGTVEFSAGGYGAQYEDKMSSVLDVSYRIPKQNEGSFSASLMGAEGAFGTAGRHLSQIHGVRYRCNSSLLNTTDSKGEYKPDFFDWQSYLVFKCSQKFKISALGNVNLSNYRFYPGNRTTNFGTISNSNSFKVYFDGREKDHFVSWIGGLSLDWQVTNSTAMALQISAMQDDESIDYDISGEYWLDQTGGSDDDGAIGGGIGIGRSHERAYNSLKSRVISAIVRGITVVNSHYITYGAGIKELKTCEDINEWERRDSVGFGLPTDPSALKLLYSLNSRNSLNNSNISAYIQDNIKFNTSAGFFNISGGVRVMHTTFNKETVVSPRASFGFVPAGNPRWAIRLAAGLYHQTPSFREIKRRVEIAPGEYEVELNNDIKSQRSLQLIAGADFTFRAFNRPFKLSGEGYFKKLSDLIPYQVDNLQLIYAGVNSGSGSVVGFDAKLFGQFVPGSDSWISVGVMRAKQKIAGMSSPMPNERRYSVSLFFTDYLPGVSRMKVSLRGVLTDGLPQQSPLTSPDDIYFRTPAYKRVDVGASYSLLTPDRRNGLLPWIKSAWLGVECFNLFDISNVGNYYWVTDVNSISYAVPNGLTRRMLNIKLLLNF